ncbi:KAT8 regulatory NSL complex subunit 2-like [Schistocerca gregaria]|uniref:KAT8 regulatory NSL complex subunit 2-like n=1 Tax=Schistocerca gregaria TaxID=7010 RepID=UPI00211EB8BC|nr:KAT8 regulatory NSL complex subunit 2-like [Schistocerca gregaria]XP_049852414.1 KAT8 regulatory NSL complex subunit 2-like [Schistocerca gregaria]XP_049852415.1 KAT8 regulatory NSL complex subunit 2-like [Schistocerca gregaria]
MQPHTEQHKVYESLKPEEDIFDYYLQDMKEETNTPVKCRCCDHNEYVKTCDMPVSQSDKTNLSEVSFSERNSVEAHIYKEKDHQLFTAEMIPESFFPSFNLLVGNHNSRDIKTMTSKYHENQEIHSEVRDNIYKRYDITSSSQSEYDSDKDSIMSNGILDTEHPPNYSNDCLKNAGIYTLEEVLRITSSKLIRLKYLYKKQLGTLEYHLKEGYRKYLSQKKQEKEMWGSQIFPTLMKHGHPNFEFSKATTRYHQHSSLAKEMRKLHDQRTEAGMAIRKQRFRKCIFTEGGVRCTEQVLPLAKHCIKHILSDSKQILFQACGSVSGEVECRIPVLTVFPNTACVYHTDLKQYSPDKKVTETVVVADKMNDNEPTPMQTEKV